jgi:hypothetical protein
MMQALYNESERDEELGVWILSVAAPLQCIDTAAGGLWSSTTVSSHASNCIFFILLSVVHQHNKHSIFVFGNPSVWLQQSKLFDFEVG